jgi:multiple antibiotic resistance protein
LRRVDLWSYFLLATSSLFVILDPIAVIPTFLAMTPHDRPADRIRMAWIASLVTAGVLLLFTWLGRPIFRLLGITLPAFQIAGSVVLFLVALDMLRAQRSRVQTTSEEADAGLAKTDVAITPLAVPMLAGPGTITTSILLREQARDVTQQAALAVSILLVSLATYLIFRLSAYGARWLTPIAMRLTTRIMGLLLAAVAVQFFLNALMDLNALRRVAPPG